jgi:two-component system, OmpR family, phosphate regulon sensor histidine kinase PhoR
MDEPFDAIRFLGELTAFADHTAGGRAGLTGLRRIVDLGLWTLGAPGLAFVEFGPEVGRVVAAAGTAEMSLGRRISSGDPRIMDLQGAGRVTTRVAADLPPDIRTAIAADDRSTVLIGQVTLGSRPVGLLIGALPVDADGVPSELRMSTMAYLAAAAERLYSDDPGLPLHADPAPRAPTDTTVLLDRDGAVCWVNPKLESALSSAGIVVGAGLPLPVPGPGQVLEHALPDGRWLRITSRRLPDDAGQSISIRDITEAHRWEQSRELFVALASHELRTPVTVIKGYADTLTDRWDSLDDPGRRHAARVLGLRAGDLARLLDRLLSAVGEPGVPHTMARFDLRDAVAAALDALPADARGRIRTVVPLDLPPVFGEQTSISSVVSELVTNAIKYSAPASGLIDVIGVSDARTVGLQVSDHGIGVRPEHVESAFERFWQADTGDHRRYAGVGLGLYLVRRIVERQNGWVSLRPRESGGTVAEVRLPRGDLRSGEA